MAGLNLVLQKQIFSSKAFNRDWETRLIETVINNLTPDRQHKFIFICQIQHERQFNIHLY